jgi:hypothetical protein
MPVAFVVVHESVIVGGPVLVLTLGDGQAMVVLLAVNDVMTGPDGGASVGGGAADVATLAGVVVGGPPVVVAAAVVVTARVVVAFFAAASEDPSSPPHAAITEALASTATRVRRNLHRADGRSCCANRMAAPPSQVLPSLRHFSTKEALRPAGVVHSSRSGLCATTTSFDTLTM